MVNALENKTFAVSVQEAVNKLIKGGQLNKSLIVSGKAECESVLLLLDPLSNEYRLLADIIKLVTALEEDLTDI